MVLLESKEKMVGEKAPGFNLPGVDGKNTSLKDLLTKYQAVVVMFVCNHCPYVQAYWDRVIQLAKEYQSQKVAFVGINPNDEKNYPEDSMDNMKIVAQEKGFPFAYLRDDDQSVAKAYDAVCTPEFYVVNSQGIVCFHGGVDDSWNKPDKVKERFLKTALDEVLADQEVSNATPHAMGCSIKWLS
jgi:peroxiredoxin